MIWSFPLSAKGLTHGEIAAHLAEVYGAEVSKQTITAITDRVMEGMAEWQSLATGPGLRGPAAPEFDKGTLARTLIGPYRAAHKPARSADKPTGPRPL